MSKIEDPILIPDMTSHPAAPPAGLNKLYALGTSIYLQNSAGSPIDLSPASDAPLGHIAWDGVDWLSNASITVHKIKCRDSTDASVLNVSGDTVVSTSSIGLNGLAQSANLSGTISVTAAASTITGSGTAFLTDFVVGDVIYTAGAQGRIISVITDNTSMTVSSAWTTTETSVTYKRGGLAGNCLYNLYCISNGATTGYLLSTRTERVVFGATSRPLVDLPAGYTLYRQLPFDVWTYVGGIIKRFFYSFRKRKVAYGSGQQTAIYTGAPPASPGVAVYVPVGDAVNLVDFEVYGQLSGGSGTIVIRAGDQVTSRYGAICDSAIDNVYSNIDFPLYADRLIYVVWGSGTATPNPTIWITAKTYCDTI